MLFTSYSFLFLFLPLFFLAYCCIPARARASWILVGSYLFYGFWRFDFCLLLLAVTAVGFFGSILIDAKRSRSRFAAIVSVSLLLLLLGWFKYAGFIGDSWNGIANLLGWDSGKILVPDVILPVGISFFTFQTLSYVVDVYRGLPPCRSFISFAAYVSLFPQLVAGPIVRYTDVLGDLEKPRVTWKGIDHGVVIFMLGFCKKVWIANNVAPIADWMFSLHSPPLAVAWLGLAAYTIQIYFDFSGYSDMAIGLGLMMGFTFPENFRAPYRSSSITEFWQRWHITMSSFFRDYLYISMGGNRAGRMRTLLNLMITMLLAGLWHGAGWTFVIWGGFHGLLLAVHRVWKTRTDMTSLGSHLWYRGFAIFVTLVLVMVGWVFFRAESLSSVAVVFSGLIGVSGFGTEGLLQGRTDLVFWIVFGIAIALVTFERTDRKWFLSSSAAKAILLVVFVGAVHELGGQAYNPFLYFQF
ncbi:MAG: membrane-bound O-acyltransferase family protein [Verrucomicrobiales bacterium]|nr:membrane-bound O-acyltransferase family protein [Verrucomicrobiales bacterium]